MIKKKLRITCITFLANEVMFSIAFVCLSVSILNYKKSYERIVMKSYGEVWGGKRKK